MLTERDLDLLSAYIDGTLNATERAELEARLQTDAELRRELATLRATVALVKGLPTLRAPRDFTLTPQMVRRPPRILTSAAFSAVSVAAAVMLFVLGAGFLLNSNLPPTNMAGNQVALLATAASTEAPLAAMPLESATNAPELDEVPTVEDGILNAVPISPQGTLAEPPLAMLATSSVETYSYAAPEAQADGETMSDAAETEMEMQRSVVATVSATETGATQAEEMADMSSAAMAAPSEPSDDADTGAGAGAAADTSSAFVQQATEQPTETPTETPTQTPSPTATFTPSASPTATETPTSTPTATLQPTPIPTPAPVVGFDSIGSSGIGAGLIVLAVLLLAVALVTTILRRRA